MALLTLVNGTIEVKDQLKDYKFRGDELESMNFLEFMLNTYEVAKEGEDTESVIESSSDVLTQSRRCGRPLSTRISYQEGASKGKRCRIIRQQGHEMLPRIMGKWFCRSDDESEKDLFRASMLLLLKPWRKIHELKESTDTFESAFETFMLQADEKSKRVVANVQYYYECSDGAKAERTKAEVEGQTGLTRQVDMNEGNLNGLENEAEVREGGEMLLPDITDNDIERALMMRINPREWLYGGHAVALGYDVGFFNEDDMNVVSENTVRKARVEEQEQIRSWETQLKAITREQLKTTGTIRVTEQVDEPDLQVSNAGSAVVTSSVVRCPEDQQYLELEYKQQRERPQLTILNKEQRRAHDIIEERLKDLITRE